ncbi:S-adenosyl-L-methionine-dependent methyltransferase [Gigaspora rosea]|uniref:S-adenosyl-L-methionine-dependent methyltransferase n=1 Tax=Gigaspora rosea TaxID=44941 RepID=A0A397U8C5_9GLOM|nr:S-adenosyl-L-methionine-dependent methyltransferase [Gigaspora rosea]
MMTDRRDDDFSEDDSPYFIPVTESDHYVFKSVLKGNYISPIDHSSLRTCLDIAYGGGAWMMEMATDFPNCHFYGIDIEPRTPDAVYPRNCTFDKGDFLKKLPYPDNMFDLVHIRLTLVWLPIGNLLEEIARVTKPGGYIEFLDQDVSTCPVNAGPLMTSLVNAWKDIQISKNIEVDLMLNLDKKLIEKGFENVQIKKHPVPMGKWAGMVGEFFLSAFKLFTISTASLTSGRLGHLSLQTEDEYAELVQKLGAECEEYQPVISIHAGFAKKI